MKSQWLAHSQNYSAHTPANINIHGQGHFLVTGQGGCIHLRNTSREGISPMLGPCVTEAQQSGLLKVRWPVRTGIPEESSPWHPTFAWWLDGFCPAWTELQYLAWLLPCTKRWWAHYPLRTNIPSERKNKFTAPLWSFASVVHTIWG